MVKNSIIKSELDDWAANSFREYASETISVSGIRKRLRFLVCYNGKTFRVMLGDEIIYEGPDFYKATHGYHTAG